MSKFVRRLILLAKAYCLSEANCPAVLLLPDGRFAVIGELITLPEDSPAHVGFGESVVAISVDLLREALKKLEERDGGQPA